MTLDDSESGARSLPAMPVSRSSNGLSSPSSPLDSRIPRLSPSPTPLRRSSSLRLRASPSSATGANVGAGYHYHHDLFPAIKENGCETPRRSASSLSLTPSRRLNTYPRAGAAGPGHGHGPGPGPGPGHGPCNDDCSDVESLKSYGSNYSTASACDHASFARNGTTWSGKSRRYVFHCTSHANENEEYLTPTQRAARQIRELQSMLKKARLEIEDRDREIGQLTREVVELRLYKASLNSPDEKTDSSEAATVREIKPFSPDSPTRQEVLLLGESCPTSPEASRSPPSHEKKEPSSLIDSGHFEDGSLNSKESAAPPTHATLHPYPTNNSNRGDVNDVNDVSYDSSLLQLAHGHEDELTGVSGILLSGTPVRELSARDTETKRLVDHYERRIEEMHRRHVDETQLLKQNHNDKVENLLYQLSEVSTRYYEARPSLDAAETRTKELQAELESLRKQLDDHKALLLCQEEQSKQTYLKMYSKGQEAARIEQQADRQPELEREREQEQRSPGQTASTVVAELRRQLAVTRAELDNMKLLQDTRNPSSYSPEPLTLANRSQSLLSVQEAVSLWVLGKHKVMYRRMMEFKNGKDVLDPEIKLQFLKSTIYYFLTDKENLHVHLNVIENLLNFTATEKSNIDRIYGSARK